MSFELIIDDSTDLRDQIRLQVDIMKELIATLPDSFIAEDLARAHLQLELLIKLSVIELKPP